MTKYSGDADHAHRLQQVDRTHLHTKALHEIAEEAVKYHDKYINAMERLMSCLLDNSDCMEEMRKRCGDEGERLAPTYEVTGAVAGAFNNFKSSVQVKTLRDSLCKLADVSTIAKRNAKVSRSKMDDFEVAAKKSAKRSTAETEQKIAQAKGKKKVKLLQEQQAEETRLANLNAAVEDSLQSLCAWWAERLASEAEDLFKAHHDVGVYLAQCFTDASATAAPPPSAMPGRSAPYPRPSPPRASEGAGVKRGGAAQVLPRDDTSSYVGVSDYLSGTDLQLPRTERRQRQSNDGVDGLPWAGGAASSSPVPAALYAPVRKEPAPMPSPSPSREHSASSH